MTGFSNPALSKSVRWIIAAIGIVILVSVYGVWRTIDQQTGGGFWSGALRGALVFGGIGLLWAWAKRDSGKKSGMVSEQPPAGQIPVQSQATPATPVPLQQRAQSAPTSASTAATSVDEDAIYTTIAHELETGATDKGLWTRLFAECEGNENKTKARYIRERAELLIAAERAVQSIAAQPVQPDRSNHPWRRFFARTVDLLLLAVPLYLAFFFSLLKILPGDSTKIVEILTNEVAAAVIAYWLWVPVEAWFLATFGATPAKWIFGISVLNTGGRTLTYPEALKRAAQVCIFGDGFGIPVVALFSRAYAYDKLKKTGTTKWDGVAGSVVRHCKWGAGRVVGATVVVAVALVSSSILLTIGRVQESKVAAKTNAQSNDRELEFGVVSASQKEEIKTAYYACMSTWPDKYPTAWKKYIKEYTDYDGNATPYSGMMRPDIKDCKGPEFFVESNRVDYPSGLSGWEEYRLCIRDWQERNQISWQRFLRKEAENGSTQHRVMQKIATLRPDLRACESKMPRFDASN